MSASVNDEGDTGYDVCDQALPLTIKDGDLKRGCVYPSLYDIRRAARCALLQASKECCLLPRHVQRPARELYMRTQERACTLTQAQQLLEHSMASGSAQLRTAASQLLAHSLSITVHALRCHLNHQLLPLH